MKNLILHLISAGLAMSPVVGFAQTGKPKSAVYISKEEVDAVNRTPGIDRTLRVVDIGAEHFAVGVIHRGPIAPAASASPAPGAPAANTRPCGVMSASPPKDVTPGLSHDK